MENNLQTAAETPAADRRSRLFRLFPLFLSAALLAGLSALTLLAAGAPPASGLAAGAPPAAYAPAPQEVISGEWTAEFQKEKEEKGERVQLTLVRRTSSGHNNNMGFGIQPSELQGLTREQAFGASTNVRFRLAREAGSFDFEGTFRGGKGAGLWTLTPSQTFVSAMAARGFDNLSEEQRVASAMLDVRTKTVDDLKSAGFERLTMEDVIKATIFKVTPEYISELKSLGYEGLGLEELVKGRIFKIDAAFAREVEAMGFGRGSMESLVKLRIFKVTPDFMREMKAAGLQNLSAEQLVKLRIFKIDGDFIERARANGYTDLSVEGLVRMKIFSKDKDKSGKDKFGKEL